MGHVIRYKNNDDVFYVSRKGIKGTRPHRLTKNITEAVLCNNMNTATSVIKTLALDWYASWHPHPDPNPTFEVFEVEMKIVGEPTSFRFAEEK